MLVILGVALCSHAAGLILMCCLVRCLVDVFSGFV